MKTQSNAAIEEPQENNIEQQQVSVPGSYSFKAVSRNKSVLQKRFLGREEVPAPSHYRPNYSPVTKNAVAFYSYNTGEPTISKDKALRVPECVKGET